MHDVDVQNQCNADNTTEPSVTPNWTVIGKNYNDNIFLSEPINNDHKSFFSEPIINDN